MKVLAFGAHPDDAEVGMGGSLAKYAKNKHEVLMVVAAIPKEKEIRWKEAEAAARILGAQLEILDINPVKMVLSREIVGIFDRVIEKYCPDVIYTHWNHDSHQDHAVVSNAVLASARKNNCSLYLYEQIIPGGIVPYSFRAQSFIDITDTIDVKLSSIAAHRTQLVTNHERWLSAIKGRAAYRGYQINTDYAEAFEVVKEIKQI
jgi:LmbE family N-acetylglucosaminyl deacetylase